MKDLFMTNVLALSLSKEPEIAINEWEYMGLIQPQEPVKSSSFNNDNKTIKYPIVFYNFKTGNFINASTASQYQLRNKGEGQEHILKLNPKGDGNGIEINSFFINKILTKLRGLNLSNITPQIYRLYKKYDSFFKCYNFKEDTTIIVEEINKFLNKYSLNNCCRYCKDEFIYRKTYYDICSCEPCYLSNR